MRFLDDPGQVAALRSARTIAVLGANPDPERAAYWIPEYLASVGYRIIPVATMEFGVDTILGERVVRSVREAGPVDLVSVFRKPADVSAHLADLLDARPPLVWFQSGLLHGPSADILLTAGIAVAHACIGCRRAAISPATDPLW